jgi:uncharacterized protein YcnI
VFRRVLVAGAVATAAVVILATPAFAHVTVSPEEAVKGSDAVLTFNVPNEMDNANTSQLEISFPTDHPIAAADVLPIPGWTAKVNMVAVSKPIKTDSGSVSEAVGSIIWTGGAIEPGQFQQFTVSVGLPDDASSLVFKALQTYSDGQVVRWIELTPAGGEEPEHPAPVLTLTAAKSDAASSSTAATVPKDVATTSDVDSAKTIGIIGIVLGALGLLVAIIALVRRPKSAS